MAVIEIAKIQVRRGQETVTGIPNLDPGEFGWAEDTQHLYIGRSLAGLGTGRDAPTRVLTQPDLDNIFTALGNITTATTSSLYTYRVENQYLTHNTLTNFQVKLDSLNPTIYDFGANPTTTNEDITAQLKGAVRDLFRNEQVGPDWLGPEARDLRRQLILPAGTYVVTDTIDLPPYASIVGAGPDKTKIIFDSTSGSLFQTIDLEGNNFDNSNDAEPGSSMQSGVTRAREVYIGGMTLEFSSTVSSNNALISLDNVLNAKVENCVLSSNIASTFANTSTSTVTLKTVNTITFYVSDLSVNYFAGQEIIATVNTVTANSYFLRGTVSSYNTSTGELVLDSNSVTDQFNTGTFDSWDIVLNDYLTTYGYAIHGVGIQLRGEGSGIPGDINLCENITIRDCTFDGLTTAVYGDGSVVRMLIENNLFNNLDRGIYFTTATSTPAPSAARISRNRFQNVIREAVYVGDNTIYGPTFHVSEGNFYSQVGNGTDLGDLVTTSSTCTAVINFVASGNQSVNDYFSRKAFADATTNTSFYYVPIVKENALIRDDNVVVKAINPSTITPLTKFCITGADQKIDVNYQMTGNGLSRKGSLLLNLAPDGFTSYTDFYNFSQTVQTLEKNFTVTTALSTTSFRIEKTTSTLYIDDVSAAGGNWYVVGVTNQDEGGVVTYTTVTNILGVDYYEIDVSATPAIDFTVPGAVFDFAYSDFAQPTFAVNSSTIVSNNYITLEALSSSAFGMTIEYRTDQQI